MVRASAFIINPHSWFSVNSQWRRHLYWNNFCDFRSHNLIPLFGAQKSVMLYIGDIVTLFLFSRLIIIDFYCFFEISFHFVWFCNLIIYFLGGLLF